jgi:hypothetical protein
VISAFQRIGAKTCPFVASIRPSFYSTSANHDRAISIAEINLSKGYRSRPDPPCRVRSFDLLSLCHGISSPLAGLAPDAAIRRAGIQGRATISFQTAC